MDRDLEGVRSSKTRSKLKNSIGKNRIGRKRSPSKKAEEDPFESIRLQWKRFVQGLPPEGPLRNVILESWRRSRAYGIDPAPSQLCPDRVAEEHLQARLDLNRELVDMAALHLDWISSSLAQILHAVFLVDRDGIVLYAAGNDARMRESFHVLPGYDWSAERKMGTNAVGTALAGNQAIAVSGPEHFIRLFHGYTCSGVPIHANGGVVGAIGMGTPVADGNPERMILTSHTAYVIEQELMHRKTASQAESIKAEAMMLLSNSLDYKTTLSTIAHLVVPRFADWCIIDMVEEDRSIVRFAVAQADPSKSTLARDLQHQSLHPDVPYGAPRVIRTGRSELYPEISESQKKAGASDAGHSSLIRKVNATSGMVVPIPGRGRVLGAITFISAESGRRYNRVDLALAEDLARRAGLAVENAQLYRAAQGEITERKRAEEAVRDSREQLQAILDNTTAVVYLMGLDDRFILINRQFEGLFNLKNEETRGRSIDDVFPKEVADAFHANNKKVIDAGHPLEFEERAPLADGVHAYLSIKVPLFDQAGKPYAICGISSDITDRKRMEETLKQKTREAEEANRAKSQFVSIISHELRTPLNAIIGYSGLLRRPEFSEQPGKREEMNDRINYNAQILLELINNLLNLNRMEAGQMPVENETVFVADVAGKIVDHLRAMGAEKGLQMELINEHGPLPIRSDLKKTEQIIRNLISNAIKFTDRGSVTVRLSDHSAERRVSVDVADTGIGIAEEVLPRLFEPFSQADPSNPRSDEGSGLGLSIVKKFTELLGGTVQVASKLEAGTTFTISLPYERQSRASFPSSFSSS